MYLQKYFVSVCQVFQQSAQSSKNRKVYHAYIDRESLPIESRLKSEKFRLVFLATTKLGVLSLG
jgi:hypothetical protein